ncbi:signal peptidase 22kDa subunit [Gilbertella persicaria]|uniref:signal peptidase 22kDa subunit n=1 Tax=Gilbertella persicaria TaxID=101096 RepID=UPI00221F1E31|nr:signal peptidase 22kDa subunit [Gilbertella persicaria]KAI8056310.1 signal peptidase 22kDa subunit [Gilbertella persicaria]
MYNLQQRANNLFSFAVTVIGTVLGLVALISAITGYGSTDPNLQVDTNNIKIVTRRYGPEDTDYRNSKSEFARLTFDIDADFTPMFNWNTKQVFVTVVADYQNKQFGRNRVVLWDKIITSKEKAHLKLRNVRNKYALIDISQKWSDNPANLTLLWDVTPYVGLLQAGQSNKGSQFIIPSFASQK